MPMQSTYNQVWELKIAIMLGREDRTRKELEKNSILCYNPQPNVPTKLDEVEMGC